MDDFRTVAALAELNDSAPAGQQFMLISAPPEATAAQSDCDCACPVALPQPRPQPLLSASRLVWLHPQARFTELGPERDGDGARSFLLFIPSVLSGLVVNHELRAALLALRQPAGVNDPRARALPHALLQRCLEIGVLLSEQAQATPAASETLVGWLHVTNACNLRCTYCYLNKNDEAMSAETGYAAVDALVRSALAHGYQTIKLKFAGGEATLNFPLIWELHRYAQAQTSAHGLALEAVVLSNGVGLGRANLRALRQHGIHLMISLDGFAAEHDAQRVFANGRGSFHAVARSIERACELGLTPDISVTVSGQTAGGLAALVGWLIERELPFNLNFYRENDCSASFAELQLDQQRIIDGMLAAFQVIERHMPARSLLASLVDRANLAAPHSKPCGVGESYMVIDQHGGVAKCQMEIERPVGSVYAPDPLALVRADTAGVINLPAREKQGCRECEWRDWCAGGCPIATFRATGRYDLQSPNCAIYKALYPAAVRLEGLRLLKHGPRELFSRLQIAD